MVKKERPEKCEIFSPSILLSLKIFAKEVNEKGRFQLTGPAIDFLGICLALLPWNLGNSAATNTGQGACLCICVCTNFKL
jgi:hypothetical protein